MCSLELKHFSPDSTACQVALNPLPFVEPSLWKTTVIEFPELMMGLGSLEPQYFSSKDPWEILTKSYKQEGSASKAKL